MPARRRFRTVPPVGRARTSPRADVALAVVLATYALAEGIVLDAPAGWLVLAPAVTGSLAWRARHPVPVVAGVLGLIVLPGALGFASFETVLPLPLFIVAGYTAGHEAPSGRLALLGATAVGAVMAASLLLPAGPGAENSGGEDLVAILVLVGGAATVGRLMRLRRAENRRLHALTAQLAAEQDLRAEAAVAEERARVARELHDIVAHSISLIAVQAGAAEELLGRDEARARAALQAVQETARSALGEMRRLLTVLRAEGDTPDLAPQPGLAAVGELVEQARAGGLPVQLREEGTRGSLPAGVDLSAFRIVQEALTNVRRHAGTVPTEVLVRYAQDRVAVEVSNADPRGPAAAPAPPAGGYGVTGMQERARLYGGTLDAGRRDGRYVVAVTLPLEGPAR